MSTMAPPDASRTSTLHSQGHTPCIRCNMNQAPGWVAKRPRRVGPRSPRDRKARGRQGGGTSTGKRWRTTSTVFSSVMPALGYLPWNISTNFLGPSLRPSFAISTSCTAAPRIRRSGMLIRCFHIRCFQAAPTVAVFQHHDVPAWQRRTATGNRAPWGAHERRGTTVEQARGHA